MNNAYITVGLDFETADRIVVKRLEQQFWDITPKIVNSNMFHEDDKENKRLCEELRDAYVKVLDYNGVYITKKRGKYTYGK